MQAAAFTEKRLATRFTVWTRWRSALGRCALGSVYYVILTADGRNFASPRADDLAKPCQAKS